MNDCIHRWLYICNIHLPLWSGTVFVCVCVCNAFHFFFFPQNFSFFLESGTLGTRQYTLNGCFMCICWYEFYMLFGGEKGRSWRR